jgi:UDP-2-acetamido-2-deoxy-ribo-hexuluronate aminotransferase
MNASSNIQFIDLKTQYAELRSCIDRRIQQVLEHGQYILGPEVKEAEGALAQLVGARHCVTVASGTEALLIALMALGVGPGDEVVTTPFTFIATAEVIVLLGAKPVFVDIERNTCNLDVGELERAITPRTRAILPVSLYGQTCDMAELNRIARARGIPVVEDAAQSFGAVYQGASSCHVSTIGCTSFFPSKPLGCYGDGGALLTDDDALAVAAREIRVHGQSRRYHHTRVGVGGRMDTLQCAVILGKLERFGWEVERRQAVGRRYDQLMDAAGIPHVVVRPDRTSVYAQYTVFVEHRDEVAKALSAAGVPTAVHYPSIVPAQPAYSQCGNPELLESAVWASERVLSLPMHPYLEEATQDRIVAALVEAIG